MKDSGLHPAPEWLTKEYLEPVMRRYKKDEGLKITGLKLLPATAKGDNYVSVMTRIKLDYRTSGASAEEHHGSYIAKTTYESDPFVSSIFKAYDPYHTEMLMYEKILPQLTELLHEIGDEDKLFADTVHVDYEHSAIIFEDLSVSNFVVADRLAGMDMEHTRLALKKLAKMHATAAVLNERMPDVLEHLDHGIFNRHTRGIGVFFENMVEECANFAGECSTLGDYYKEKLLKLKPHIVEQATRVCDQHEGNFHTLCHGDYWINNVMLRYNNDTLSQSQSPAPANGMVKSIQDIKVIDFQFCNWCSPAVDLHYFFNTSLQADLRNEREAELVQFYYYVLADTLRRLHYAGRIPTLHEFCVQIEAGRFYALPSALGPQSIMVNDKTENADFQALILDDEQGRNFRRMVYCNKALRENLRRQLPNFDRKGLLDVVD